MHAIEFQSGQVAYIPENLSECDATQYIEFCNLLFLSHTGQIHHTQLLTDAVYKLMNVKVAKKNTNQKDDFETESTKLSNIILLQELIESTFFETITTEDGSTQQKIIQGYINNPVLSFRPTWRTYYGPSDGFMNVKCGEYTDACRVFSEFNSTGDIDLLYDLVAILYRPKKQFFGIIKRLNSYDGDCRIAYNSNTTEARKKQLKYAPMGFIYGVYLYFASFQIFVSGAAVPWGDKTLDLSILFSSTGSEVTIDAADIGLDSVLFTMAESGAFGDLNKVQQTPLWTMLIKMYDARITQLKEQKAQENANNQSPS
jgi:hypothetical protein